MADDGGVVKEYKLSRREKPKTEKHTVSTGVAQDINMLLDKTWESPRQTSEVSLGLLSILVICRDEEYRVYTRAGDPGDDIDCLHLISYLSGKGKADEWKEVRNQMKREK